MRKVKYPCLWVLLVIFISSGLMSLDAADARTMTKNQYQKISLSSSKGKIDLFAPDKCIAGDTISGKMMAEPAGKILDNYSVEIAGVKTAVRDGWATWTVPEEKDFTVTLLNKKGKKVDSIRMPVHDSTGEMKPRDFQCPGIIQVGHAFPIPGQYNGGFGDTIVRVGEEKVEKLVESPRVLIVEPPPQQTGEIEISVQEGNVTKTFRTRNISVLLHADDLHLKRGQTTVFTVTVKGLEELEERLPLYVTNHSRETVNLEGEGTVWIEPSAVNPEDGSFVFESSIAAHTSGSFRITATVIDEFAFALPIEPPDLGEADKGEIGDDEELDLPKKDEIDWEKVKKAIERAVKQHKEYWERRGKISPKKQGDEAQEGEQKADEKEEDDQDDENEDKKKDDEIKKLATELRELWKKLIKKIDEKADDKEIEAIHNEIKKKESELTKAIFRQAMEEIEGE